MNSTVDSFQCIVIQVEGWRIIIIWRNWNSKHAVCVEVDCTHWKPEECLYQIFVESVGILLVPGELPVRMGWESDIDVDVSSMQRSRMEIQFDGFKITMLVGRGTGLVVHDGSNIPVKFC